MKLVGSREAQAITGLSADQLREWSGRRGLVSPDIPARGKGTQARFSWRTLLLLRISAVLKAQLHVELAAFRADLANLQEQLAKKPFHSLWSIIVAFNGTGIAKLHPIQNVDLNTDEPLLLVTLRPHLGAITRGFHIDEPSAQLPLFPAVGLR